MKYLLDTCVVSELIKKSPNKKVVTWLSSKEEGDLFLSVLTFGEIHKGIEKLVKSKKKKLLHDWVKFELQERFENRVINFNLEVATTWGKIQAFSEAKGKAMPTIDGQIAATGLTYNLIVVTRNTSDMEVSGVELRNPWK